MSHHHRINEDTNVTTAYAESDLEESIPDQQEVNPDVADLFTMDDKTEKTDDFLEDIYQTVSSKENITPPLHCSAKSIV